MQPIGLCDMDGVLVNFMQGALALHGRKLHPGEIQYDFWHQLDMTAEDFWRPMDAGFWARLPWHAEGADLLKGLEGIFGGRVAILTSCGAPGAEAGKREWVARELRKRYQRRFHPETQKWKHAHPHAILIDDYDKNVDTFRAAGGLAVLVPRPWNTRKADTDGQGGFDVAAVLDDVWKAVFRVSEYRPADDAHRYPLTHPFITSLLPPRTNGKPYTNQQLRKWVRTGMQDAAGTVVRLAAERALNSSLTSFYTTTRADVRKFVASVGRMFAREQA